jgi:hypothetical protein
VGPLSNGVTRTYLGSCPEQPGLATRKTVLSFCKANERTLPRDCSCISVDGAKKYPNYTEEEIHAERLNGCF